MTDIDGILLEISNYCNIAITLAKTMCFGEDNNKQKICLNGGFRKMSIHVPWGAFWNSMGTRVL